MLCYSRLKHVVALPTALAIFFSALFATVASAHSYNESYVFFNVTEDTLSGRVEATLEDLTKVFAPDAAEGVKLTEADVIARQDEIFAYFEARMELSTGGTPYVVDFTGVDFLSTEVDTFAQLQFDVLDVGVTPRTINMSYSFLFGDVDPTHRGFALIESNTRNGVDANESFISLIFEPGDGALELNLNDEPTKAIALKFLVHGIWHIWLGFDHVLFLVTLLLSSVMVLRAGAWAPTTSLRESMIATVKIVTVFTLAHTVTLALAAFEVLTLPVVFVEAVIALSIAFVAFGNLMPRFHMTSWKVVFVFGLFHGFGFANVLAPLGLDPARKAIGLATFNIGVEVGQIAIVIVLFPVLFLLRKTAFYRVAALQVGSIAMIAIALFWFVERTYGGFLGAGG